MKKRILVLAESLNLDATSEGGCTSKFLMALKEQGFDVTCLHSDGSRENFPWLEGIQLTRFTNKKIGTYNLIAKLSEYLPIIKKLNMLFTGFSPKFWHEVEMYQRQIATFLKKEAAYDCVFVRSAGSSFRTHFAMMGLSYSGKWIAHFHDPFPFSQYPEPYRYFPIGYKHQEKWLMKLLVKSPVLSFPSEKLIAWAKEFSGRNTGVLYMPHVAYQLFDSELTEKSDKCVLLHSGALLKERSLQLFSKAFQELVETSPSFKEDVRVEFQGNINSLEIQNQLEGLQLLCPDNIIFKNQRVTYAESIKRLKEVSYAMIIEAPSDSSPFLPGKLVDAVAHATNIIAISPKNSEVSNLLGESYPYLGDSKKMPDIKEALWNAYENWLAGSLSHPRIGELKSSFSPSKVLEPLK